MDHIKEAFHKVKEDINQLREEINSIKSYLNETKDSLLDLSNSIKGNVNISTHNLNRQTDRHIISTQNTPLESLKPQNLGFSTGNQGVSTDRQTDNSTDRHIQKEPENKSYLDDALKVVDSLDNVKKELRIKFKKITDQEALVFSTIYQLEEDLGYANYKLIAEKLSISESSVRDHVGSLLKKGIPVEKNKINNKQISLSISSNLKKIAPLSTILMLREL